MPVSSAHVYTKKKKKKTQKAEPLCESLGWTLVPQQIPKEIASTKPVTSASTAGILTKAGSSVPPVVVMATSQKPSAGLLGSLSEPKDKQAAVAVAAAAAAAAAVAAGAGDKAGQPSPAAAVATAVAAAAQAAAAQAAAAAVAAASSSSSSSSSAPATGPQLAEVCAVQGAVQAHRRLTSRSPSSSPNSSSTPPSCSPRPPSLILAAVHHASSLQRSVELASASSNSSNASSSSGSSSSSSRSSSSASSTSSTSSSCCEATLGAAEGHRHETPPPTAALSQSQSQPHSQSQSQAPTAAVTPLRVASSTAPSLSQQASQAMSNSAVANNNNSQQQQQAAAPSAPVVVAAAPTAAAAPPTRQFSSVDHQIRVLTPSEIMRTLPSLCQEHYDPPPTAIIHTVSVQSPVMVSHLHCAFSVLPIIILHLFFY